jgi:hypothetical protein
MESDINYPKSKAFNIFLRFLQLSLTLACTIFVGEFVEKTCITPEFRIVEGLVGVVLLVSLLALVTLKCTAAHPKLAFIVFFVLDLAAVVAIALFSLGDILMGQGCAASNVFYQYYLGATALYTLLVLLILLLPLLWVQRFTNSPGNIVWVFFFIKSAAYWH